jgi:large subunit ribosomal protein L22
MVEEKIKTKMENKKIETKVAEAPKVETNNIKTVEKSKPIEKKKEISTKSEAIVNGKNLKISTKHAAAICNFIRNKNVDLAINELGEVEKMKRAIPMRGEIPHRKGKGMMSGRYPLNATKEIIALLKSLKSNAVEHNLELEKLKLFCMANVASRPHRRFGRRRFKRSHVQIKLIPMETKK